MARVGLQRQKKEKKSEVYTPCHCCHKRCKLAQRVEDLPVFNCVLRSVDHKAMTFTVNTSLQQWQFYSFVCLFICFWSLSQRNLSSAVQIILHATVTSFCPFVTISVWLSYLSEASARINEGERDVGQGTWSEWPTRTGCFVSAYPMYIFSNTLFMIHVFLSVGGGPIKFASIFI